MLASFVPALDGLTAPLGSLFLGQGDCEQACPGTFQPQAHLRVKHPFAPEQPLQIDRFVAADMVDPGAIPQPAEEEGLGIDDFRQRGESEVAEVAYVNA